MTMTIFQSWLPSIVKYLFSYHSMNTNHVFIEKTWMLCINYSGWFWSLLWIVFSIAKARQSAKRSTMHAKRLVVLRRVVAMSHCRSTHVDMSKRQDDIETTRPITTRRLSCFDRDKTTVQQRVVWRVPLTTRRKGEKDIGCVVAVDNATHKVYQISHIIYIVNIIFSTLDPFLVMRYSLWHCPLSIV
jgi:hypothetical protein